jgi:hypothetical protein
MTNVSGLLSVIGMRPSPVARRPSFQLPHFPSFPIFGNFGDSLYWFQVIEHEESTKGRDVSKTGKDRIDRSE